MMFLFILSLSMAVRIRSVITIMLNLLNQNQYFIPLTIVYVLAKNFITKFSEGLELSYFWEFGDGNTSLYKEPNYSYSNNGIYEIDLEVTDSLGCSNKYTFSEHIYVLVILFN